MKLKKGLKSLVVLLILPFICSFFCGFTATGDMQIKHNGKGNITMTIESELSELELSERLQGVIDNFNTTSGQNDMLKIKEVEKTASGYVAVIQFRRIDKIKTRGDFLWYKADLLKSKQSMELDKLSRWELGDVNCKVGAFYNDLRGFVEILKPREGGPKHIVVPCSADGQELTVEQLVETVNADSQVLLWQNCDTLGITNIRVTFPGAIAYYGGENVRVIDESTVEITPVSLVAKVTKNDVNTLEPIITMENINVFLGYVIFDKSVSPFMITIIVLGSTIVLGLIGVGCIFLHKRGKRILMLKESIDENEKDEERI